MARISTVAFKQLPIQHNSATNASGDHHGHEVVYAACPTDPAFCEGKSFCITISKNWQASDID
jgi:hypothetical protein